HPNVHNLPLSIHPHLLVLIFLSTCPADHPDLHLSLHDALPIFLGKTFTSSGTKPVRSRLPLEYVRHGWPGQRLSKNNSEAASIRSEEHTSELQSLAYLVCRLLLEKKKSLLHRQGRRRC